ncbi:hypothetical protein Tco_0150271 [Tanacetum coccineum]
MPFLRFTKFIINHFLSQHKSLSNLKFQHYHTIKGDGIKSRGKGLQGKKTADTYVADVDVPEESDFEPARKRTASRRVVKKKVTISTADNIIPDPNFALELGKSINLTEAAKEEAARQVHATHARIVTESEPEPAKKKIGSRSTKGVNKKLQTLCKLSKKARKPAVDGQALGSNKGTGVSPGVLDESIVVLATSSEGTGTKLGVLDEEKVTSEENVILEWVSEQESEYSEEDQGDDKEVNWIDSDEDKEKKDDIDDDKSIDLEMTNDEFVHSVEQVNDDEDEEITNAEVEESGNDDEENTDAAKTDARKIEEVKDDAKKAELPLISSSLSVSSGFGDQFLKLSSDTSLSLYVLTVPVSVIFEPFVLTPILVTPSVAPTTTLLTPSSVFTIPPVPNQTTTPIPTPLITTDALTITNAVPKFDALFPVQLRVAKLEKDVSELTKIDHSAKALAALKSQVPTVVEQYLRSKIGDDLQKSALKIRKIKREQAEKQKMPKLYHALMKALIEDENSMDKGVANTVKDHKIKYDDDDEDPSARPNQGKGKAPLKGSKTSKSAFAKEPVEEPIAEVAIDDAVNTLGEDVVRNDDQPQDTLEPKTYKTPNQDWFKQPPRPPTPDPEWNKRQVILDQPEQT